VRSGGRADSGIVEAGASGMARRYDPVDAHDRTSARPPGTAPVTQLDHIGGQHRREGVEISPHRRVEEGGGHLPGLVVGGREPGPSLGHPATGSGGDLAARLRCAVDHLGDLGEGDLEHIGEQEHHPLDRRQSLEHRQEADGERLDQLDLVSGI
jgi:hypothetical protein